MPMRAPTRSHACLLAMLAALLLAPAQAFADAAAARFMQKAGHELLQATRSKSPHLIASAIQRYGDVGYLGSYALGSYRSQLTAADRPNYTSGMVRFLGRYAAQQAPKYPVARFEIGQAYQGGSGIIVESRIHMRDGTSYDVQWLLAKYGSTYRVRDASVYGFWMAPFLKKLFETYIAENGGSVKALVAVLTR